MAVTYKIGEAAAKLQLKTHVLRFWETEFPQIVPLRTDKGQRLYTEGNINLLRRIKFLLHEQGHTIEGAKKSLDSDAARGIFYDEAGEKNLEQPEDEARFMESEIAFEDLPASFLQHMLAARDPELQDASLLANSDEEFEEAQMDSSPLFVFKENPVELPEPCGMPAAASSVEPVTVQEASQEQPLETGEKRRRGTELDRQAEALSRMIRAAVRSEYEALCTELIGELNEIRDALQDNPEAKA